MNVKHEQERVWAPLPVLDVLHQSRLGVYAHPRGVTVGSRIAKVYAEFANGAKRFCNPLKFSDGALAKMAELWSSYPCSICGENIEKLRAKIVWDVVPVPYRIMKGQFTLKNVLVLCELCGDGKGDLAGCVLKDMIDAVPNNVRLQFRQALARGRLIMKNRA